MKKAYQVLGAGLLLLYAWAAFSGWELPGGTQRNTLPPGVRSTGGYRSYHFWSGGK